MKHIFATLAFISITGFSLLPAGSIVAATIFTQHTTPIIEGDSVLMNVFLNTENEEINVIDGSITLSGPITITAITTGGSIFNLWPTKPSLQSSPQGGTISFVGGATSGISGPQLKMFTVAVTAKETGTVTITSQNVKMFKNDGQGTAVAVTDGSYATRIAQRTDASAETKKELTALVLRDENPPEPFTITLGTDQSLFNGKYFISFGTIDTETGIDRYEVKEGNFPLVRSGTTYVLQDQSRQSDITVTAIDLAGNTRTATLAGVGIGINWTAILITVALLIILKIVIIRKRRQQLYE